MRIVLIEQPNPAKEVIQQAQAEFVRQRNWDKVPKTIFVQDKRDGLKQVRATLFYDMNNGPTLSVC